MMHQIRETKDITLDTSSPKKILVCDDNKEFRSMLVELLMINGYSLYEAEDGEHTLQIIKDSGIDLLVTDIVMPNKEGLETIIAVKKAYPTLPIIAMSGGMQLNTTSYLSMAESLGAKYTFCKPVKLDEFLSAVEQCLKG